MSAIPPPGLSSILQTTGAQQRAAGDKAPADTSQAERSRSDSFASQLQDVIEASDRDSQVYADAEGAGSQGRPSEGQPQEEQPGEEPNESAPPGDLDVQA